MPKRSTYDPESWSDIAKNKGFSILNLDNIDPDDFKATDKLQLQCIKCESIVQPTISEMVKSRYVSKKCRCQVWKAKQEAIFEDTADWKVINRLDNFFTLFNLPLSFGIVLIPTPAKWFVTRFDIGRYNAS